MLLEDLLEQEKREQEKQQQQQQADTTTPGNTILSDIEFERLQADVLNAGTLSSASQGLNVTGGATLVRTTLTPRQTGANWQQIVPEASQPIAQAPRPIATQTVTERKYTFI